MEMTRDEALKVWLPIIQMGVETMPECKEALDMAIKALAQEPTTKNDLGVYVSRQAVDRLAWKYLKKPTDEHVAFYEHFLELPPITPQKPRWIPASEKLPNDRDWYLGIFKEPNTGWINPIPFICDYVGKETKATTKEFWILRGFTDRDEHIDYYFNLECVAWMPFPLRNSIDDLIMREVGNE